MHWIIRFLVYHRNITTFISLAFISLWMMTSAPVKQQQIARILSFSIFYPFQYYISQSTRVKNIFAENRKLKEDNASQAASIALLKEQAQESGRLEGLLKLENNYSFDLQVARVAAREPSKISRGLIISAGKENGIAAYMPVFTSQGVVGKVIQVLPHLSMVQLLSDPSNRTSVMLQRSREVGILETENGDDFFIRYRTHADVNPGDTVVTSGLGGVYLKGLMIGIVSRVDANQDPLFKKVQVKVSVDFDRLEEVFVIRVKSQWSSFRSELDSLERTR
jgi:rod shape-determining protein MreC